MLRPWWRHDGCVPEVDDDQLAALLRLRVAFAHRGRRGRQSRPGGGAGRVNAGGEDGRPGADAPEERKQAHALLTRALTDSNWRTASQALDDLMRKLRVVHRLLEAEERLAKREPRAADVTPDGP
jgi:hypothetical protein